MRIILEEKRRGGKELRRVERADKRDIREARRNRERERAAFAY